MTQLPVPDESALHHSEKLTQKIRSSMDHGTLSFADYMQLSLYAPGLGYYAAGATKFGAAGDFVTAPLISPLFAATLAQFIVERTPGPVKILELGAGTGDLAKGLLQAMESLGRDCTYAILELSPDCQARQREALVHYLDRVEWLSQLPKNFEGVILANEVLDAMPVHVFRYQNGDLYERRVAWKDGHFVWKDEPMDNPALALVVAALPLSEDDKTQYISEVNLILPAFVRSLVSVLRKGALLFIDYGFVRDTYYHATRHMGTLMCHYRHYAHTDPFLYPGLQDITAHVDFSVVGETAEQAGCDVLLYTQAEFLIHHGLLEIMETALQGEDDQAALRISQEVQTLLQPQEMGELFKVMVITR